MWYDNGVDAGVCADTSDEVPTSPTSNSDADPELPRDDYNEFWKCVRCGCENRENLLYQYCRQCFSARKRFYPARPRQRLKKKSRVRPQDVFKGIYYYTRDNSRDRPTVQSAPGTSQQPDFLMGTDNNEGRSASQPGPSTSHRSRTRYSRPHTRKLTVNEMNKLCPFCLSSPQNGLFIHSYNSHRFACYECSKTIFRKYRQCFLCSCRVLSVDKLDQSMID